MYNIVNAYLKLDVFFKKVEGFFRIIIFVFRLGRLCAWVLSLFTDYCVCVCVCVSEWRDGERKEIEKDREVKMVYVYTGL